MKIMSSNDRTMESLTVTFPKASIVEGVYADPDYVELRVHSTGPYGTFCLPVHRQYVSRQSLHTLDEVLENVGERAVKVTKTNGTWFIGTVKSWNDTTVWFWVHDGKEKYSVARNLINEVKEQEVTPAQEAESAARPLHSERTGITYSPMLGYLTTIDICDKCGMLVHYAHRNDHDSLHVLIEGVLSAGRNVSAYLDKMNEE